MIIVCLIFLILNLSSFFIWKDNSCFQIVVQQFTAYNQDYSNTTMFILISSMCLYLAMIIYIIKHTNEMFHQYTYIYTRRLQSKKTFMGIVCRDIIKDVIFLCLIKVGCDMLFLLIQGEFQFMELVKLFSMYFLSVMNYGLAIIMLAYKKVHSNIVILLFSTVLLISLWLNKYELRINSIIVPVSIRYNQDFTLIMGLKIIFAVCLVMLIKIENAKYEHV